MRGGVATRVHRAPPLMCQAGGTSDLSDHKGSSDCLSDTWSQGRPASHGSLGLPALALASIL